MNITALRDCHACGVWKGETHAPGCSNQYQDVLRIHLVYPERRFVSFAQIVSWWDDAVANGEIDAGQYDPEPTLREAIADLEDIGHITVGE